MAIAVTVILIIVILYITVSTVTTASAEKALNRHRGEITELYVRRANLMPNFLAGARKCSPVPMELYNRFIKARDDFARAGKIADIRASNAGIKAANAELTAVFEELFSLYSLCREALYIKTHEDYTKILEKISFTAVFYEKAWDDYVKIAASPLKYGAIAGKSAVNLFRRGRRP